jgi:ribosome maturation factor RimP
VCPIFILEANKKIAKYPKASLVVSYTKVASYSKVDLYYENANTRLYMDDPEVTSRKIEILFDNFDLINPSDLSII